MLLVALVLSGSPLLAATNYEGKIIGKVEFEPAAQPLRPDELLRILPFKAGDKLDSNAVRTAIEKLYITGRYADIAVDVTETADARLNVRVITEPNYFIGRVSVAGAIEPPNAGQLSTASKLQLGTLFTTGDLRQASENIQGRLRANGFYKGAVDPKITRQLDIEQINIDFSLDPGPRAKFSGLNIEGTPERSIESITRSTRWKRFLIGGWRPLTENRLQSGIENIRSYYQKHDRLLAKVRLSRLEYDEETNRVAPTISIDEGPLVKIRTEGEKVSMGRLRQLLPIFQERSVDRALLVEGRRNLVEYFQSQGYFDVRVDFTSVPLNRMEETVLFTIDRQERHKLKEVAVEGNKYFNDATIRERMYLAPASLLRFRHGRYSQRYLDRDIDAIQDLYRSNGFRDVSVRANVEDDYQGKPGYLAVTMQVTEGPQWYVAAVEIAGVTPEERERLLSIISSQPGQPFSEFNVANDRDAVLATFYNNGFPDATFEWSQTPADAENRVNLKFNVAAGRRQFVRNVIVGGLDTTDDDLVYSRIRFGPGDPVSQVQIFDTQRRLYDLGIFAKVQTALQNPDGLEESKYVLYQVEEARRYSFNAGIGAEVARIGQGVTTFDAPAGAAGFAPRVSLGVSRINFLGLGHTISLQTRASTLQQRAVLSYYAPQFKGRENLNLTFTSVFDKSRDVRTFAARRLEGSVQLGQRLSRSNTIQYRFTYRDVYVDPNSVNITPQLIPILSQSVRVGLFSGTFIRDRRDDPIDARRGSYNTIDLGVAARPFGSQSTFGRMLVRNASYYRVNREVTFARSTTFGLIERFGGLEEIPLPERFFSGGATSHRGFPDNQAGPRDTTTGFPLGSTALLMNSLELRFPLIGDNVGGVLFHDAGNGFANFRDISFRTTQRDLKDFNYMVHAVGFGIRYRTPVGPIRIDLAVSPNSPRFFGFQGSRDELLTCSAPASMTPCRSVAQRISVFQFHFSLGQAF